MRSSPLRSLPLRSLPARSLPARSLLVVVALLTSAAVAAAAPSLDDATAEREATRAEQARVAAELDLLEADAGELRAALAGLDEAIAYQEAEVDAARRARDAAVVATAVARQEAARTAEEIERLQTRVADAVVDAYIGGLGRDTAELFAIEEVTELGRIGELREVVRGRFGNDLEELRGLRARQASMVAAAEEHERTADAERSRLDAALTELGARRDVQSGLVSALLARIGDVQAEAERLEAAEAELTSAINQHLAATAPSGADVTPSLDGPSAAGFIVPVAGPVTSPFGYRIHPILGYSRLHAGTDFGAPYGSPVWASKSGSVIFSGWNGGYGYCVIIGHEGGFSTLYGHLSELAVSSGQSVGRGDVIGWVGSTGTSTGPHLHFEVWAGGQPIDPLNVL